MSNHLLYNKYNKSDIFFFKSKIFTPNQTKKQNKNYYNNLNTSNNNIIDDLNKTERLQKAHKKFINKSQSDIFFIKKQKINNNNNKNNKNFRNLSNRSTIFNHLVSNNNFSILKRPEKKIYNPEKYFPKETSFDRYCKQYFNKSNKNKYVNLSSKGFLENEDKIINNFDFNKINLERNKTNNNFNSNYLFNNKFNKNFCILTPKQKKIFDSYSSIFLNSQNNFFNDFLINKNEQNKNSNEKNKNENNNKNIIIKEYKTKTNENYLNKIKINLKNNKLKRNKSMGEIEKIYLKKSHEFNKNDKNIFGNYKSNWSCSSLDWKNPKNEIIFKNYKTENEYLTPIQRKKKELYSNYYNYSINNNNEMKNDSKINSTNFEKINNSIKTNKNLINNSLEKNCNKNFNLENNNIHYYKIYNNNNNFIDDKKIKEIFSNNKIHIFDIENKNNINLNGTSFLTFKIRENDSKKFFLNFNKVKQILKNKNNLIIESIKKIKVNKIYNPTQKNIIFGINQIYPDCTNNERKNFNKNFLKKNEFTSQFQQIDSKYKNRGIKSLKF